MILRTKLQKAPIGSGSADEVIYALESKMDDILIRLRELEKKIEMIKRERIEEIIEEEKCAVEEKPESVRTIKVKNMIKSLLEQHGKLTAEELGKLINLSRTRCSEYLKDMERKGILKSSTVRRKRFYELKKI